MSRTRRKLNHRQRNCIMYPWIDWRTLQPYDWGSRQWRHDRRDAAQLRGDDGKCRKYRRRGPWQKLQQQNKHRSSEFWMIKEGLADHYDNHDEDAYEYSLQMTVNYQEWLDKLEEEHARLYQDDDEIYDIYYFDEYDYVLDHNYGEMI